MVTQPSRASSGPMNKNEARRRLTICAAGAVVLMDLVTMTASLPFMVTHAPNIRSRDSICVTSLMAGKFRMVTGSRVSKEAASIGSTAFLDVPTRHVPESGPLPVMMSRFPLPDAEPDSANIVSPRQ